MSTDSFRRHTRARVDDAIHRIFLSLPGQVAELECLARVVRQRSDLLTHTHVHVDVLRNLLAFRDAFIRSPDAWPGMRGHPLRVVEALAGHLFGSYPTPRFLASAWFGGATPDRVERRRWFIAQATGQPFRKLALPIAMTRQMVHLFLNETPDHLAIDPALRRAEVLGLGGSRALADAVLATHLAEDFRDPERWRTVLAWLVRCGDTVDLVELGPLVDFLRANLGALDLRGRTFASVVRRMREWHEALARERVHFLRWPRSRWNELVAPIEPTASEPRRAEWRLIELLDSYQLAREGREMRHCVVTYARRCARGSASIWSLQHRWCDAGTARSVITLEVSPWSRTIVQVRGPANSVPRGAPLELVRRWAARERLTFDRYLGALLSDAGAR